jgi:hypothetical protein
MPDNDQNLTVPSSGLKVLYAEVVHADVVQAEVVQAEVVQARFSSFLDELADQGTTQQEVARRLRVSPAYVCDCKRGRRTVSELFARRLEHEFGRNHRWFLGGDPAGFGEYAEAQPMSATLPVFPHPISGEPSGHRSWNGIRMELCGIAASRAAQSRWPYILRCAHGDRRGRLRRDDLVLVSQTDNPRAQIRVVNWRRKVMLARRTRSGWEILSKRQEVVLEEAEPVGHCVAIVWAGL